MSESQSSPNMLFIVLLSLGLHGMLAWGMAGGARASAPVRQGPMRVTVRDVPPPLPGLTEAEHTRAPGEATPAGARSAPVAPRRAPRRKAEPARPQHASAAAGGGRVRVGGNEAAGKPAALVALDKLSRLPRAPALERALAVNHPNGARRLGRSGQAVVSARILPSGQVAGTAVLLASAPEFGKACQRTLASSRWSAPLDARGRPVATELSYKCTFESIH